MPYLSHNYRCEPRSRLKEAMETILLVATSSLAVLLVLLVLGWVTALAAEAAII